MYVWSRLYRDAVASHPIYKGMVFIHKPHHNKTRPKPSQQKTVMAVITSPVTPKELIYMTTRIKMAVFQKDGLAANDILSEINYRGFHNDYFTAIDIEFFDEKFDVLDSYMKLHVYDAALNVAIELCSQADSIITWHLWNLQKKYQQSIVCLGEEGVRNVTSQ
jgi:hypothetical protein